MSLINSIILGIVQGLTEFLPVSSSGHLVIFSKLIGVRPSLSFTVLLHLATLLAVCVYFWKDILELISKLLGGLWQIANSGMANGKWRDGKWQMANGKVQMANILKNDSSFRMAVLLLVATVFTGLIAFPLRHVVNEMFDSTLAVGIFLLITACIILFAEAFSSSKKDISKTSFLDAVLIGIVQGVAVFPGISRSGSCISACLLCGQKRELAARFSFILAIPVILGSGLVELKEMAEAGLNGVSYLNIFVSFAAAFISGLIAIKFFMELIKKTSIRAFAYYCIVVGIVVIAWSLL